MLEALASIVVGLIGLVLCAWFMVDMLLRPVFAIWRCLRPGPYFQQAIENLPGAKKSVNRVLLPSHNYIHRYAVRPPYKSREWEDNIFVVCAADFSRRDGLLHLIYTEKFWIHQCKTKEEAQIRLLDIVSMDSGLHTRYEGIPELRIVTSDGNILKTPYDDSHTLQALFGAWRNEHNRKPREDEPCRSEGEQSAGGNSGGLAV